MSVWDTPLRPPTIVRILSRHNSISWYAGSAFVWKNEDDRTFFITAAHVVDGMVPLGYDVVVVDWENDLAILASDAHVPGSLVLADCPPSGSEIRYWGNFGGVTIIMSGIVANQEKGYLDLDSLPGMSGGAIVDEHNRIIGVLVGGWGSGTLSLMIHSEHLRALMETVP